MEREADDRLNDSILRLNEGKISVKIPKGIPIKIIDRRIIKLLPSLYISFPIIGIN
jgi:hypothetical protein